MRKNGSAEVRRTALPSGVCPRSLGGGLSLGLTPSGGLVPFAPSIRAELEARASSRRQECSHPAGSVSQNAWLWSRSKFHICTNAIAPIRLLAIIAVQRKFNFGFLEA